MESTGDVVIVGGGIIGCAIAYNLRKVGVDVILLDKGEIGAEASSEAAGLLAPLGPLSGPGVFADLLLASFSLFPSLVPELEEVSGIHTEYERTGALRVVRNPRHIARLRKRMQAWQPLGLEMHWLSGDEARQHEPMLSSEVCAAIYAPEESQISASQLTRAFAQAAILRGARLYSHKEITGIQYSNARVTGVQTAQGETITCSHLIIAAGAWSARCSEWLNIPVPVSPQRGQTLALRQPIPPSQSLGSIVFGEATYLASKGGDTILVGASKDEVGFDKHVTAGGLSWLLSSVIRLAPTLELCAIERVWAGLRPKTPDSHPILGTAPGWENVTLAVGHGSVGIILSAITGQAIAEIVVKGRVPEIVKEFGVERFGLS